MIKKEKVVKSKPSKGVKAYFITKYDPRMLHPRQLISRNYHHMEKHPLLRNLFPRENLVGGTRRLRNLSEILSPTAQSSVGVASGGSSVEKGAGGRWIGSSHAEMFKAKGRCDICSHMVETSTIYSPYFTRKFAIHGRNIHLPATQKNKHTWFFYCCEDTACSLIYVGSTSDVCKRWANTKKACLDKNSNNTGLYKHFKDGCPANNGARDLSHLRWTLVDHMETSEEKLIRAGHQGGAQCRCVECSRLKELEDKWICRLGSFHGVNGLNSRDEIKSRTRVNYRGS